MQPDAIDDQFSHLHGLGFGGLRCYAQPDNRDLFDPADDWDRPGCFRPVRPGALCARAVRPGGIRAVAPVLAARPWAPARGAVAAATAALSVGRGELRPEIDELTHRGGGFQCREPLVDLTELEPPREQVIKLQATLPP